MKNKIYFITSIIFAAALSRLLPHPWNFTPMVGITLASAVFVNHKKFSFVLPLITWLITDLIVNGLLYPQNGGVLSYFTSFTALGVYTSMMMIWGLGLILKNQVKIPIIIATSLSSSMIFYLISNSFVFIGNPYYTQNFSGWFQCMYMGIPFYQSEYGALFGSFMLNGIMGDLFYTSVLFGLYYFVNGKSFNKVESRA
jgi:hypothetical protein